MTRALRYLAPPLFCLLFYWRVPFIWFRIDDFAWLGLPQMVHGPRDLATALFHPYAQGTIRVLSERIYFLVLGGLFGIYAAPFRAVTLGTWFLDLAFIQAIGARLTGSRTAGLLAALLWTASVTLATPLMWSSAYNQVLCAFCVLAAFYSRLRWLESGEAKWKWMEAIAFLAGFGALETIVVYPVVVVLYAWASRTQWRSALWMFVPSIFFALAHLFWIPKENSPAYQLIVDGRLPLNLLQYLAWAVGPSDKGSLEPQWQTLGLGVTWAIGLILLCWTGWQAWKGNRIPLFCCGWFLLFLAPLLPLPNHVSPYYLTIPGIGLAWISGNAVVSARRLRGYVRVAAFGVAAILAGAYLAGSFKEIKVLTAWHLRVTSRLRIAMRGIESLASAHPGSTLVMQGVDAELMRHAFQDNPFRLVGLEEVYLAPGGDQILDLPEFKNATRFRTTPEALLPLLDNGKARVLNVADNQFQDVTLPYRKVLGAQLLAARRTGVDLSNPLYASRLGEGWYPIENGARWMAKTASVTLSGLKTGAAKLVVTGFVPHALLARGPLPIRVRAEGKDLGSTTLTVPDKQFEIEFALPRESVGSYSMRVTLECGRTIRPPNDPRELGAVIQKIEVR